MGDEFVPCTDDGSPSADRNTDALLAALTAHTPLLARKVRWAKAAGLIRHANQHADAWQAARLGFIQAWRRYDNSLGASIGSFARQHVTGAVRGALEASAQAEDISIPLDAIMEDGDDNVLRVESNTASRVEAMETSAAIRTFVVGLPRRQQHIVKQVFWEDRSQADVARDLGVSRKTVTKTLQKVYARGRNVLAAYHAA